MTQVVQEYSFRYGQGTPNTVTHALFWQEGNRFHFWVLASGTNALYGIYNVPISTTVLQAIVKSVVICKGDSEKCSAKPVFPCQECGAL